MLARSTLVRGAVGWGREGVVVHGTACRGVLATSYKCFPGVGPSVVVVEDRVGFFLFRSIRPAVDLDFREWGGSVLAGGVVCK